ncbi:hypothetical protein F2Q70_00018233 [Brassica cretica]|uniref:Uncharacterized protein n=1 Tax=Brassica cretica TaxID=69181 RepID=A0A8S9KY50_BRACR|nr:hypothetical protein F2Q70_00018233 [Brassica cretica]KAF2598076.1 hypothetical protein F2Q68_00011433 [Brassica cretica]
MDDRSMYLEEEDEDDRNCDEEESAHKYTCPAALRFQGKIRFVNRSVYEILLSMVVDFEIMTFLLVG